MTSKSFNFKLTDVHEPLSFSYSPDKGSQTYVEALEYARGLLLEKCSYSTVNVSVFDGAFKIEKKVELSEMLQWIEKELEKEDSK